MRISLGTIFLQGISKMNFALKFSIIIIVTGLTAGCASVPQNLEKPALSSSVKIEHWETALGSGVYYVQTKGLPMVDIEVVFDAGSARDGQQFGLSFLTSAMLDTGAGNWDADSIAKRFESVGAQFGTAISRDNASVSLRTLTREDLFNKAIETMQVILTEPKFDSADFQREKSRTLAALKHREESPGELASIAFYEALYGKHPYAHPPSGFIHSVAEFSADDLRAFYRQFYVAANAMIVIVGDLSRQQAEQLANKLLSGLPKGQKPETLPPVTMPVKGKYQHIEFPSRQTHVLSGLPGTRGPELPCDPRRPSAWVVRFRSRGVAAGWSRSGRARLQR